MRSFAPALALTLLTTSCNFRASEDARESVTPVAPFVASGGTRSTQRYQVQLTIGTSQHSLASERYRLTVRVPQ